MLLAGSKRRFIMVKNKTGWNRYFLWRFFTILLLGALFVLTGGTGSAAPAGSLPVITVSTPEEFMMAIGPDRIIRIEEIGRASGRERPEHSGVRQCQRAE